MTSLDGQTSCSIELAPDVAGSVEFQRPAECFRFWRRRAISGWPDALQHRAPDIASCVDARYTLKAPDVAGGVDTQADFGSGVASLDGHVPCRIELQTIPRRRICWPHASDFVCGMASGEARRPATSDITSGVNAERHASYFVDGLESLDGQPPCTIKLDVTGWCRRPTKCFRLCGPHGNC